MLSNDTVTSVDIVTSDDTVKSVDIVTSVDTVKDKPPVAVGAVPVFGQV